MASRWYLRDSSSAAAYGKTGPTGKQSGQTDGVPSLPADKNTCHAATMDKGSSEESRSFQSSGTARAMVGMWASPPLAARTIDDGATFTLTVACRESLGLMTLYLAAFFYVWREGTGKVKDLGADQVTDDAEAWTTQRWRQLAAVNAGDFTLANGDQIVCEVWGSYSTIGGPYTATFYSSGSADDYASQGEGNDVADSASWFECSQTLGAATHPYYYPGLDRQRGLK